MIILAIILSLMLAAVVYYDSTEFIIPNELNLGFIILYPAFLMVTHARIEWWYSLAVMGSFFAIGYLIFMAGIMGGGDVKLLIALSLWIGWHPAALAHFGVSMALAGGVLALVLVVIRGVLVVFKKLRRKTFTPPKIFRIKEPLPYGLAIVYAFGELMWTGQIYGLKI